MKMPLLFILILITPLLGEWECEVVESLGLHKFISYPYIGVDTLGRVHIGYGVDKLHYVFKENGNWVIDSSEPTTSRFAYGYPDMAIDPGGNPHYFFTKEHITNDNDAYYAKRNEDGTWEEEEIPVQESKSYTIAVDKNSVPHVIFTAVLDTCFYGYKDPETGQWNLEPLSPPEGEVDFLTPVTIALDRKGFPHMSYLHYSRDLYHIYYDGSEWHYEVADTSSFLSWIYLPH